MKKYTNHYPLHLRTLKKNKTLWNLQYYIIKSFATPSSHFPWYWKQSCSLVCMQFGWWKWTVYKTLDGAFFLNNWILPNMLPCSVKAVLKYLHALVFYVLHLSVCMCETQAWSEGTANIPHVTQMILFMKCSKSTATFTYHVGKFQLLVFVQGPSSTLQYVKTWFHLHISWLYHFHLEILYVMYRKEFEQYTN